MEDGQLDNSYQDQRQGNTFSTRAMITKIATIETTVFTTLKSSSVVSIRSLVQGSFTDQHALGIVFFQNSIQLIDLGIYLIGSGLIFGVHQKEFPVITL